MAAFDFWSFSLNLYLLMTSVEPLGAESRGASGRPQLYTGSDEEDEEDSSVLADLTAMFPAVAHDELVTILRSHGGDLDATVDYLMALSLQRQSGETGLPPDFLHEGLVQAEEQFSSEIGGLPEVLPASMTGDQTDSDSEDEDTPANHAQSGGHDVGSDEDPLPTYEEAVIDNEGYTVAGSIMLPTTTNQRALSDRQSSLSSSSSQPHTQKKKSEYLPSEKVFCLIL